MAHKTITYFGKSVRFSCDEKCSKAWGINSRPRIQLSDDIDDYAFLADDEVGEAPMNPGTYDGFDTKPVSPELFPNKWCLRECERCQREFEIVDFTKRFYNIKERL